MTAERWSQRQDPSPSGGAGAAGACYYTGALQHKGREKMILSGHRGSLYSLAASQLSAKKPNGRGKICDRWVKSQSADMKISAGCLNIRGRAVIDSIVRKSKICGLGIGNWGGRGAVLLSQQAGVAMTAKSDGRAGMPRYQPLKLPGAVPTQAAWCAPPRQGFRKLWLPPHRGSPWRSTGDARG